MELKEFCDKTLAIFECDNVELLKEKIYQAIQKNESEKYDKFCELVNNDLSIDWLQKIFQYYEADRKIKKQDYTPATLAKLVGLLANGNNIVDMCAGSGALTIQTWNINKNAKFKLYELDSKVIPYLIFNLIIRNIEAEVINGEVLSGEIYKVYKIKKGEKYGEMEEVLC